MHITVNPRRTERSIGFTQGGYYFLKNNLLSVSIVGTGNRETRKGHIHLDMGSFTLSYRGVPVIVDPGTGSYTRSKKVRDKYRSIANHNVPVCDETDMDNILADGYFSLSVENRMCIEKFNDGEIIFHHHYFSNKLIREIIIDDSKLRVTDTYSGHFRSYMHLHPAFEITSTISNNFTSFADECVLRCESDSTFATQKYPYSPMYGLESDANRIVFNGKSKIEYSLFLTQS